MRKMLMLGAAMAAMMMTFTAQAADPIKLGVLEDQSGDFALATIGKVHGIQLATDEINAAGGIAGRKLELVIYDTQSDNTRYQEFMRRVLQRDKVDVVFAGLIVFAVLSLIMTGLVKLLENRLGGWRPRQIADGS